MIGACFQNAGPEFRFTQCRPERVALTTAPGLRARAPNSQMKVKYISLGSRRLAMNR